VADDRICVFLGDCFDNPASRFRTSSRVVMVPSPRTQLSAVNYPSKPWESPSDASSRPSRHWDYPSQPWELPSDPPWWRTKTALVIFVPPIVALVMAYAYIADKAM
jgi:hypothetical protein